MDTTSELAATAAGADPRVGLRAASALRRLAETLEAAQYEADLAHEPPRLLPKLDTALPQPAVLAGGIAIDFRAGYGAAADVPAPLRQAILMLVAHWFETRAPIAFGLGPADIPMTVAALVAPYRRIRL